MSTEAAEYLKFLESEWAHHDLILCHRPLGQHPKYFVGLHRRTRKPIYTFSPHLARRFSLRDRALAEAFMKHMAEAHGHELFATKHKLTKTKEQLMKAIRFAVIALALCLFGGMASAQNLATPVSTVPLSMNVAESISVSATATGGGVTFTQNGTSATASSPITVAYSWNLAPTRQEVLVGAWLGSVTAALTNGTTNIPSSEVVATWSTGGGTNPCTASDGTTLGINGAECAYNGVNLFTFGLGSNAGSIPAASNIAYQYNSSFSITLALQNLPATLTPGNYTGTFNVELVAE